jgi:hypothetical protein
MQHYVIEFVSDLRQVGGFLRVFLFPRPKKTDRHDITEMLLKVVLNTINHHTVLLSIINQSTIKFTFQNVLVFPTEI